MFKYIWSGLILIKKLMYNYKGSSNRSSSIKETNENPKSQKINQKWEGVPRVKPITKKTVFRTFSSTSPNPQAAQAREFQDCYSPKIWFKWEISGIWEDWRWRPNCLTRQTRRGHLNLSSYTNMVKAKRQKLCPLGYEMGGLDYKPNFIPNYKLWAMEGRPIAN